MLACVVLAGACGSKPTPPGALQNVGGWSGREPDAAAPAGMGGAGTGGGGSGGGDSELDAGESDATAPDTDPLDAGPDARAPQSDAGPGAEQGCQLGELEANCEEDCPDFEEAPERLFAGGADAAVRRPCYGADGTIYITIGSGSGEYSSGYIYAAESGELVSTYTASDVAEWCADTAPSTAAFYGVVVQDCAAVNPDGITAPCDEDSSGPGNGGDALEECIIYSDDG